MIYKLRGRHGNGDRQARETPPAFDARHRVGGFPGPLCARRQSKPRSLAHRNSCSKTAYWPRPAPLPPSESAAIRLNAEPPITAPPSASELAFPDARRLRSRDVFRLVARVWPFIRPYRRHLVYLFLLTLPALLGGLIGLNLMRVFFDVVGHGAALTRAEAWMLRVPLHADRRTVLIHACVVGGDRGGRRPDRCRIPLRLRDLDSAAHQQSLPRQSLHADAGTERPLSFRGKNRRRDLPDVPGLRRDSKCDRRPDRSAADFLPGRHRLDPLPALVRLPDGADRRSADARELHTGVDVRQFVARRFHR